jgi:hypothetical protein
VNWRVWITGYPNCGVNVNANGIDEALRKGAATQKAQHTGEVVEINVQRRLSTIVYRYFVRLYADGRVRFEGK